MSATQRLRQKGGGPGLVPQPTLLTSPDRYLFGHPERAPAPPVAHRYFPEIRSTTGASASAAAALTVKYETPSRVLTRQK
jgi:hypothetical protein